MILKENRDLQLGFQWILKDLKKKDHNTLSFTLFSIQTVLFILLYFFMRDRGEERVREEERGREMREKRERQRERERERRDERVREEGRERERGRERGRREERDSEILIVKIILRNLMFS